MNYFEVVEKNTESYLNQLLECSYFEVITILNVKNTHYNMGKLGGYTIKANFRRAMDFSTLPSITCPC